MKLSKAQREVTNKLEKGATLHTIQETWHDENTFFKHTDGTFERSNVKVIRKLVEYGILEPLPQAHPLITDYKFWSTRVPV
jgi:hypothetical protein